MRKIFTVVLVLVSLVSFAQKKKKDKTQQQVITPVQAEAPKPAEKAVQKPSDSVQAINLMIEHYVKKYTLAQRWSDQAAVKDVLYDLIAETGNDSLAYTLAVYYYENNQFASCVLVSKDLLARTPKNISVLQISAAGFEGLGLQDKALQNYESIYLINENSAILYKMVYLQYQIKRFAECKANIDILLTKPDLDGLKIQETEGSTTKEYPIKASILNIKGLLLQQDGDKVGARKAWSDALVIAPTYGQAKQNLAKLK